MNCVSSSARSGKSQPEKRRVLACPHTKGGAINAGADPAAIAAFLGHKSPATTRKFYATHAVPTNRIHL